MRTLISFLTVMAMCLAVHSQTVIGIPDSVSNIPKIGSGPNGTWNTPSPLLNNGTEFTTFPTAGSGWPNNYDYLSFRNFGFSIPANAVIQGVQVILKRGACNVGGHFRDTIYLADNGNFIGVPKTDSNGASAIVDTFGNASDLWLANLTPAVVNNSSFGVYYTLSTDGICTFAIMECRMIIHYSTPQGTNEIAYSSNISVFPNPVHSELTIESNGKPINEKFELLDLAGKTLQSGKLKSQETTISVANLPAGIYFIKVGSNTQKFFKE